MRTQDDGKIKAEYNTDNCVLTLKSLSGQDIDMPEYRAAYEKPWNQFNYAWELVIDSDIKTISKETFAGACLESLSIPENVERIGNHAFAENRCGELVFYGKNVKLGEEILSKGYIGGVKCYRESTVDKYFTEKGDTCNLFGQNNINTSTRRRCLKITGYLKQ